MVGRSTATTDAADMACIPSSLTSSRWLMALAPISAPSWPSKLQKKNMIVVVVIIEHVENSLLTESTHENSGKKLYNTWAKEEQKLLVQHKLPISELVK